MSKIYEKYLELKAIDKDKMYLFHSGKFYIFIADDADKINDYIVLKKTPFCKEALKCGFPDTSLNDYLRVFNNHMLNIEVIEKIVEDSDINKDIISYLYNIDLDNITPMDALLHLKYLKDLVKR